MRMQMTVGCGLMAGALFLSGGAAQAHDSFAELAEKLTPAVVNISTTQIVAPQPNQRGQRPPMPQSPFEEFFEEFFLPRDNAPRKVSSLGSGFVIDPAGVIVTNNHVIESADEIIVTFSDGAKYEASLIGRDPKTDLALLRIKPPRPVPSLAFGDALQSRVGDWVIAIGNPFGLGGSLSVGVISAINRNINAGPYDSFIQTDAAINRGNSGGPLFNSKGEVIGVNSAIISPSGGSVGIGFAVPADSTLMTVIAQLREFGETRRGWLGVRVQEVTDNLAETLRLGGQRGALVAEVTVDGPAEKAGLRQGDVIVRFDKSEIRRMRDLPRLVAETPINKLVEVEVIRQGEARDFWVKIGRLEEGETAPRAKAASPDGGSGTEVFGMQLRSLDEELRSRWRIPDTANGVIVVGIQQDKSAFTDGLRVGDVIQEVDQTPVATPSAFLAQVRAARDKEKNSVLLLVTSAGGVRFVALELN